MPKLDDAIKSAIDALWEGIQDDSEAEAYKDELLEAMACLLEISAKRVGADEAYIADHKGRHKSLQARWSCRKCGDDYYNYEEIYEPEAE